MALTATQEEHLDNLVWHALTGPHAQFATGDGPALRYQRSMAVFCGVERLDGAGWRSLAELVRPGRAVVLFQPGVGPVPAPFTEVFRSEAWQMVAEGPMTAKPLADPAVEVVELGADDAAEMVALTQLTEPGPFFDETHRLGTYLGVRDGSQLVAMAGERLRTHGVAEISAVCTHPDARRRGLGALLTLAMVELIRDRGDLAILHVAKTNDPAIPLYRDLGFEVRGETNAVAARFTPEED